MEIIMNKWTISQIHLNHLPISQIEALEILLSLGQEGKVTTNIEAIQVSSTLPKSTSRKKP